MTDFCTSFVCICLLSYLGKFKSNESMSFKIQDVISLCSTVIWPWYLNFHEDETDNMQTDGVYEASFWALPTIWQLKLSTFKILLKSLRQIVFFFCYRIGKILFSQKNMLTKESHFKPAVKVSDESK